MTNKEKDLLVSILNHIAEQLNWNVEEEGFGYYDDFVDIDCIDQRLEDGLEALWDNFKHYTLIKTEQLCKKE